MAQVKPPPGFVLDDPGSNLPPGFQLDESPGQRSFIKELGRQGGLFLRDVIEGGASLPLAVTDSPVLVKRAITGKSGATVAEALHRGLTNIGLPEPENRGERIIQSLSQGMMGAGAAKLIAGGPGVIRELISGATSGGAAQTVAEMKGPPWAQLAAGTVAGLRPGAIGLRAPESVFAKGNEGKLATWQAANAAGYKFPPSVIDRTIGREAVESVAGKAALKQEVSLHNQQVTNELARRAAGLQPGEQITETALANAREDLAEPYRQIAALSPTAASAIEELKNVRAEAKIYHRDADQNGTPASVKEARRLDAEAAVYEAMIDAEAVKSKQPGLLSDLRQARVKIAQNWDVDRALNTGDNNVRAAVIGRMLDKRGVGGFSGDLLTIGKTQQAFPHYTGEAARTTSPGVSKLEALSSIGFGLGGYHYGGWKGAALGATLPLVSYGTRQAAANLMQGPAQQGIPLAAMTSYLAREADPMSVDDARAAAQGIRASVLR